MRFVGFVLLLACVLALPFLFHAWSQVLAALWYPVAVLAGCLGLFFFAWKPGDMIRSWKCFLSGRQADGPEHRRYARMHAEIARQALVVGFFAMLVGWIANFGTNEPPLVADFARSLTAPAFALVLGAVVHRPLAAWHRNKAGD